MKKTITIIPFLSITILLTSYVGTKDRQKFNLPKFGTDFSGSVQSTKESGVELIRQYPNHWWWIEPYKPGSKEIDRWNVSQINESPHKEIVLDGDGVKHYFDWTFPDMRAVRAFAAGKDLYFSTHESNTWSANEDCVRQVLNVLKNLHCNCPLKDEEAVKHFKFFIRRFVERFDNDGVDDINLGRICKKYGYNCPKDPQALNRAVNLWQLGAEYDNYNGYYHGTPEEYLVGWKAFVDTVRYENPNALIVSNGFSGKPAWYLENLEHHGVFYVGLALTNAQWEDFVYKYLSKEELARASYIMSHPLEFPTIDKVVEYLDLKDNGNVTKGQKERFIRNKLYKLKHRLEFLRMILDHPELFDVFESRVYTYYRFDPDRISRDLRTIKEEMAKRGYIRPVTTGEASGAYLRWGKDWSREKASSVILYKKKVIYGVNPEPVTKKERETYNLYMAEQSRETIKVHAKYFAEGGNIFIKHRFTDWLPDRVDPTPLNFGILGLVYPPAFKLKKELRKPVFYTYKLMTSKLKGFIKAEYINNNPEQIMFTFRDKGPVFVLWGEGTRSSTVDLSSYVSTPYIKITRIVTELDDNWNPIYPDEVVIPRGPVTIDETPVFVEGVTDRPKGAIKK